MLKYRLFVKNTFLVFLPLFCGYTLHAADDSSDPMTKEEKRVDDTKYEGATIALSKLDDKVSKGIKDYGNALFEKHKNTGFSKSNLLLFFNGQAVTDKELNKPITWGETMSEVMGIPLLNIKSIKEVLSKDSSSLNPAISRNQFIKILEEKMNISDLENKTGLRATLKIVLDPQGLKKVPSSFNELPQIRRKNIFKEADFLDVTKTNMTKEEEKKEMENYLKKIKELSKSGYIVFIKEEKYINFLNVMIFIELETPEYRRKRLTRLWGKRILIGSAVALPILLLLWGLFSLNKKNKKPPQVAKKVTTTATSSKKEASPTEENNTKRRRRKRTRRANRTNL